MINTRSLINDAGVAIVAQGISMAISIIATLFLPKVLGLEEFGYWQLFIFYCSFVGFFHFGINDGVYLIKGGESRDSIDKRSLNSQFIFCLILQIIMASAIVIGAFSLEDNTSRLYVIVFTAIYLPLNNAALYLGYVFQAMNETRLFSFSIVIDRVVFCVPLCILMLLGVRSFEPYVAAYALSKSASLVFCLCKSKDILTSKPLPFTSTLNEIRYSISAGIKLMIANVAASLILGVSRFVVDARWGIEAFGELSLSISMAGFFLIFIQQISMVLFPALRQINEKDVNLFFPSIRDALCIALPLLYLFYVPVKLFLIAWLPQYSASIEFFTLLLPLCVFDGMTDVLCTTYFKVLRKESTLLIINLVAVAASMIFALFSVYMLNSITMTLLSAVLIIIARYYISERLLGRYLGVGFSLVSISEAGIAVAFILSALLLSDSASFAFLCIIIIIFYLVFFKEVKEVIGKIRVVVANKR